MSQYTYDNNNKIILLLVIIIHANFLERLEREWPALFGCITIGLAAVWVQLDKNSLIQRVQMP